MDKDFIERFWGHTEASGDCLEWRRARTPAGYGALRHKGRFLYAHRVAWEIENGPIPDGLHVLHSCDNPPCCNPAHLRIGTHADNVGDMHERGRARSCGLAGERHPMARLTETQVAEIRARYAAGGVTQYELAPEYGISQAHLSKVVSGKNWT
jgi:hypothetical protein